MRAKDLAEVTHNKELRALLLEEEDYFLWDPSWINISRNYVLQDVTFRDMVCVWYRRWITSSALHRILQSEFTPRQGHQAMDAFFYDMILHHTGGPWKNGAEILERNDVLYVPVNERKHWSAVVVDLKNVVIYHMDSLHNYHDTKSIVAVFDAWVSHSVGQPVKFKVKKLARGLQTNNYDCGVWTVCFLVKFSRAGEDFKPYSEEFIHQKRTFFIYTYLYAPAVACWSHTTGRSPDESAQDEVMNEVSDVKRYRIENEGEEEEEEEPVASTTTTVETETPDAAGGTEGARGVEASGPFDELLT